MPSDTDISKFMSLVLRHQPDAAGLTLDENGWTPLAALVGALGKRFGIDEARLRKIVQESPKQRFTIDGGRIRAAQGHSVDVDLALAPTTPPAFLYHGTNVAVLPAILSEGLTKQSRRHVHLSKDVATARIVGARRKGETVILRIDAAGMTAAGHPFFVADNGVWLTDRVPPTFLSRLADGEET